jgi:glutamate--cysteine ligase
MPLDRAFERRLAGLINARAPGVLQGGLKGVERESLRVTPAGRIATTPHPRALGSALANEHITTDYSEALIELVTPTVPHTWELLQYLVRPAPVRLPQPGDELLWATSMPCAIDGDASIPIAQYGTSNVGRMKTVYREGLGHRYGRVMQAISGVHFNYSFPDQLLAGTGRGGASRGPSIRRSARTRTSPAAQLPAHGWIVLYLFGNSPALCKSFLRVAVDVEPLEPAKGTAYAPYATSLRMSDLGYRNKNQAGVSISVNSLEHYVRDLTAAISTPSPEYERIGVKVDGGWRQLNANLLQIENEYYSFIRPKRVTRAGERPTKALLRAGVQYVEMRALDVSAFDPVGVNQNKLRFLEAFAAFCVLRESRPIETSEQAELDGNHAVVAREGRRPGLNLRRDGRDVSLRDWSLEIIDSMRGVCELLDEGDAQRPYCTALEVQEEKIHDVSRTPAARTLEEMRRSGESFFHFALRMSKLHQAYFKDLFFSGREDGGREPSVHVDAAAQHAVRVVGHGDASVATHGDDAAFTAHPDQLPADHRLRRRGHILAGVPHERRDLVRDHGADEKLAVAGRRDGAAVVRGVGACTDDGRVADAAPALRRHATGRGRGREVAMGVERDGADRADDLVGRGRGAAVQRFVELPLSSLRHEMTVRHGLEAVLERELLGPGPGEHDVR